MISIKYIKPQYELIAKNLCLYNQDEKLGYFNEECIKGLTSDIKSDVILGNIRFGLCFNNENNVYFSTDKKRQEFLNVFESETSTVDLEKCPKITYNDKENATNFIEYLLNDLSIYSKRENFDKEYPLGNIHTEIVIKLVHTTNDSPEMITTSYIKTNDFKGKNTSKIISLELGYLLKLGDEKVFFTNHDELKEFLKDITLGEYELCEDEKVKKISF